MSSTPCAVWDWTLSAKEGHDDERSVDTVKQMLRPLFKKWTFQKERGDTGYLHFQGRGSLFKKRRGVELKKLLEQYSMGDMHCSPTVTDNTIGDSFYVIKLDTRVEGPWCDKDVQRFIPWQYQNLMNRLHPYQTKIWDSADIRDARTINYLFCPNGNQGKSTLASLCDLHGRGMDLPPVNDAEKLIESVCDILIAKEERDPKIVFIDMPRAMDKRKLGGMYSAIEQIKKGKVYDMRYSYKEWWFNSPQIWVFGNHMPDLSMLSADRWKIWSIDASMDLVPVVPVG
jgi:hypothetical protein